MKYSLDEAKALKKLGIPDFRHMTKDKVVEFAFMLPKMDPEVAKAVLQQFPNFKELASELISEYKGTVDKALESNKQSQDSFYKTCDSINHRYSLPQRSLGVFISSSFIMIFLSVCICVSVGAGVDCERECSTGRSSTEANHDNCNFWCCNPRNFLLYY